MKSSIKNFLLNINSSFAFFVASIYMGIMWSLHYFWYPGWQVLTHSNVHDHFIGPTSLATKFFTILVPIAILACIVMVITEWKTKLRWPAIMAFLGIIGATLVGQLLIIPINDTIASGVSSDLQLNELLTRWIMLNNWRMFITTIMWLSMLMFYTFKRNYR